MRLLGVLLAFVVATAASSAGAQTFQGKIAYSKRIFYKDGDSWEIFVVRPDGSGGRRITPIRHPWGDDTEPAWSPDGRKIAYATGGRIFVIDASGKGRHPLTNGRKDATPAWSPKGKLIAFERNRAIWTMRANGKQQHRLTRSAADHAPAWSPDGRSIVFVRGQDLWIIGANGEKAHKLVAEGFNPSWSPDGRLIAFDDPEGSGIFVVNEDGTGRTRLGDGEDPSWSPDGRRIAYTGGGIGVMDADGRNSVVIVPGPPEIFGPSWGRG